MLLWRLVPGAAHDSRPLGIVKFGSGQAGSPQFRPHWVGISSIGIREIGVGRCCVPRHAPPRLA